MSRVRPSLSSIRGPIVRLPRLAQVRRSPHADHADLGDVPLEQRVDRLGGRVGDELDSLGPDFGGQAAHDLDNAGRDPVDVVVRRRDDGIRDDGGLRGVEGDRLGERAADVHAYPDAHRSAARVDQRAVGSDFRRRLRSAWSRKRRRS